MIRRFATVEAVDAAFAELCALWDELLSKYRVESSDECLNRMVNIWNQYQCMITFCMSRSASFFESGIGRGMGFRDSNQDLVGFVHQIPSRARQRIIDIASTQLTDTLAVRHAKELLDKLGAEFTTQEAYDAGDSLEMGKSTVMDHLTFCRQNKLIERFARGRYRKL